MKTSLRLTFLFLFGLFLLVCLSPTGYQCAMTSGCDSVLAPTIVYTFVVPVLGFCVGLFFLAGRVGVPAPRIGVTRGNRLEASKSLPDSPLYLLTQVFRL